MAKGKPKGKFRKVIKVIPRSVPAAPVLPPTTPVIVPRPLPPTSIDTLIPYLPTPPRSPKKSGETDIASFLLSMPHGDPLPSNLNPTAVSILFTQYGIYIPPNEIKRKLMDSTLHPTYRRVCEFIIQALRFPPYVIPFSLPSAFTGGWDTVSENHYFITPSGGKKKLSQNRYRTRDPSEVLCRRCNEIVMPFPVPVQKNLEIPNWADMRQYESRLMTYKNANNDGAHRMVHSGGKEGDFWHLAEDEKDFGRRENEWPEGLNWLGMSWFPERQEKILELAPLSQVWDFVERVGFPSYSDLYMHWGLDRIESRIPVEPPTKETPRGIQRNVVTNRFTRAKAYSEAMGIFHAKCFLSRMLDQSAEEVVINREKAAKVRSTQLIKMMSYTGNKYSGCNTVVPLEASVLNGAFHSCYPSERANPLPGSEWIFAEDLTPILHTIRMWDNTTPMKPSIAQGLATDVGDDDWTYINNPARNSTSSENITGTSRHKIFYTRRSLGLDFTSDSDTVVMHEARGMAAVGFAEEMAKLKRKKDLQETGMNEIEKRIHWQRELVRRAIEGSGGSWNLKEAVKKDWRVGSGLNSF